MARPRTATPAKPTAEPTEPFKPGGLVKAAEPIEPLPDGTPIVPLPAPPPTDAAERLGEAISDAFESVQASYDAGYQAGYADGLAATSGKSLPLFEELKRLAAEFPNETEDTVREALRDLQNTRGETLSQADFDLVLVTWRRAHQAAANAAPAEPRPGRAAGTPRTEQEIRDATTYETVR